MTPVQKIEIRRSETREKLNDLVKAESAEDISLRDTLSAELKAIEPELRAAIEAEGAANTSPESREWAGLNSRFDLGQMFTNVMEHRMSTGPIAEVQKERGLAANAIPTEHVDGRASGRHSWRPDKSGRTRAMITGLRVPAVSGGFPGNSF